LLSELYRVYLEGQPSPDAIADAAPVATRPGTAPESNTGSDDMSENDTTNGSGGLFGQFSALASRLSKTSVTDLTSVLGIDRNYANRELQIAQSFFKGEALAHHLEDSYYAALGGAVGFVARVGEEIVPASLEDC
jgi:hypothetical protein